MFRPNFLMFLDLKMSCDQNKNLLFFLNLSSKVPAGVRVRMSKCLYMDICGGHVTYCSNFKCYSICFVVMY